MKLLCVQEYYISRLQTSLVHFISDGAARTKLAIVTFLYCRTFVKTSTATLSRIRYDGEKRFTLQPLISQGPSLPSKALWP